MTDEFKIENDKLHAEHAIYMERLYKTQRAMGYLYGKMQWAERRGDMDSMDYYHQEYAIQTHLNKQIKFHLDKTRERGRQLVKAEADKGRRAGLPYGQRMITDALPY